MKHVTRQALFLVLSLFVLNTALSFHNIWPTPWIKLRPELSVEIAALVLLLAVVLAGELLMANRFYRE